MHRRHVTLRLGLLSAAILLGAAGCAGDEGEREPSGPPDVTGAYRAQSDGPLEQLLLAEGQFAAVSRVCEDGRTRCTSEGTFALSADRAWLELTDAKTGTTRTIPFAVTKSGPPPAKAQDRALAPRGLTLVTTEDLAEESGQELVTPEDRSIVIQCTGNCAVTIRIGDQLLESTGESLTVTVPAPARE